MNRNALLIACAVVSTLVLAGAPASAGTFRTITPDGDFSDWNGVPILASDAIGDGSPIDLSTVQIANDANNLYIRITFGSPVNPNGGPNNNLSIDTDNNVNTGFDIYGLHAVGAEVSFQNDFPFTNGTGVFNTGFTLSAPAAISPFDFNNPADPFVAQEYSIPRNLSYTSGPQNDQAAFGNSLTLMFWTDAGAAVDATVGIPYTFASVTTGWNIGGSGDYNLATNWTANVVPNGIDAVAQFGSPIIHPETVYSNTAVTVGTLQFNNANTYVLAGAGSMTMDVSAGTAAIDVLQGSQKVNLPLRLNDTTVATVATGATLTIADPLTLANGSSLNKAGPGTLEIISTVMTLSAGLSSISTSGGTTNLRYPMGAGTALGNSAGETRTFTTQRVSSVNVSGGTVSIDSAGVAKVLVTDALTLSGAGKLDLGDNGAIVRGGSAAAIRASIISGRAGGGGIVTTAATAGRGIGYANASDINNPTSFIGESFTGAAVLVRYTLLGDANLSGGVDFNDLVNLAQNYNGTGKAWFQGDFDYNGTVDFNDLVPLAQNYNGTLLSSDQLAAMGGAGFASDWTLALSLVPEPTTLAALGSLATLVVCRRR